MAARREAAAERQTERVRRFREAFPRFPQLGLGRMQALWTVVAGLFSDRTIRRERPVSRHVGRRLLLTEGLEARRVLASTTFSNGILGIDYSAASEAVSVANNGTTITLSSNAPITGAGATFPTSLVSGLVVTDSGNLSSQSLSFSSGTPFELSDGLSSSGVETVNVYNDIMATGSSSIDISAPHNIEVFGDLTGGGGGVDLQGLGTEANPNAPVNAPGVNVRFGSIITATGAGNVSIHGVGGSNNSDGIPGVKLSDSGTTITSGGGNVLISGQGGSGTGDHNYGIWIGSGAVVSAGGTGDVEVSGNGGEGTGADLVGVRVTGSITSGGGNVVVEGTGGVNGSGSFLDGNHGVEVSFSGQIGSGGAGSVMVSGVGRSGGGNAAGNGVYLSFGTITSGGAGDVTVSGQSASGGQRTGVYLEGSGSIITSGGGDVDVTGTGDSSAGVNTFGVWAHAGGITSGGGSVNVTGIGSGDYEAVRLEQGASILSGNDAPITVTADSFRILGGSSGLGTVNSGLGSTTIRNRTAGTTIDVGGADVYTSSPPTLGLSTTELNQVTAGTLVLGRNDATASGDIVVSNNIARSAATDMELLTGGDILISGGQINTGGGSLLLSPGASPAAVKPTRILTDVIASTVSIDGDLAVEINGTTADTDYNRLSVTGDVDLTNTRLVISGSYQPVAGDAFTVVDNQGSSAITGIFDGLPEGSPVVVNGGSEVPTIRYDSGDGNDVVVSVFLANQQPTDLELSNHSIAENVPLGSVVGNFSTTDPNSIDTFTYELVQGVGDDDNASFTISGDQLLTAELFDLDTQSSFWIRVRSTDQGGLATEKAIAIIIVDFQLLKDINSTLSNAGSSPRYYTEVGDATFFAASTVTHGNELWKTDGSAIGTKLVKDIAAGGSGSTPSQLIDLNGVLYFVANDGTHGAELWKSDGTEAGTVMVKDIQAGSSSSSPSQFVEIGGTLFFTANDGVGGSELWKTDGTEAGTVMVKDIQSGSPSSSPTHLVDIDGALFFAANDGISGVELWKSDGTETGTVVVKDISVGSSGSSPGELTSVDGTLYFTAYVAAYGRELWKSDGTVDGTVMIKDIVTGTSSGNPWYLTKVGSDVFFRAEDEAHGQELWKTDGTAAGTVLVKDIRLGELFPGYPYGSSPSSLTNVNGTLFFHANDGVNGAELWKSDGTAAGTVLVKDINLGSSSASPRELTNLNGMLYFSASDGVSGNELWTTDGTEIGTAMILDIFPGSASSISGGSAELTIINGALYFSAVDDIHGKEIWTSDGTTSGTSMMKDIRSETRNGGVTYLTDVNGTLFFRADDGVNGSELWKSDGTTDGTVMIQDTNPGPAAGQPTGVTRVDTSLFYVTNDGTHGRELWKSDGTDAGTVMIKDINQLGDAFPANLVEVNGTVFFSANDGTNGTELWKSDGTAAGTVRVKDINPGSGSSSPSELTAVDGVVYFRANDGSNGSELWKSDGTASGTVMVEDLRSGSNSSFPGSLTNVDGELFFRAYDGVNGTELWKSDGTEAGTMMVKDIRPGGSSGSAYNLTNLNGTLFFTSNDGINGTELWRSDGTESGTLMVKDITPGSSSSSASYLIDVDGTLFFRANDGTHGAELWKSDGTEAGTVLVKDIVPGAQGASIGRLANINGALYFRANDGVNGSELWRSDGTESGTMMVANITRDSGSSTPGEALEINGNIFVTATTKESGQELFRFVESPVYPTITLTSGDFTVDEDVGLATITAELDEAVAFEITVPLVVESDTATIGRDLLQLGNAFTFLPGETTASVNVSITDDQGFEEAEAFTVSLGASVGVQMGTEIQNTITIEDNDSIPLVSFRTPWQITPETVQDIPIEVLLNNTSFQDITVPLTFAGSAELGSDYLLLEGSSVFIPAGQLVGQTTVRLIDDTLPERTELLIVGLDTPVNGIISDSPAASLQHVLTVQQNDLPSVSFTSIQQRVSEDDGTISVEAELSHTSPLEVRVPFLVGGNATDDDRTINHDPIHQAPVVYEIVIPPNQLTGSISVTITDDQLDEPGRDERVAFKMGDPTNAFLGSTSTHVVAIQDNDVARISFTVDSQEVWEDAGTATITISTSNISTKSIRVPISVSGLGNVEDGQAEFETDFDIATTALVIPAGSSSISRTVTIIDDSGADETERTEPTERVEIGLGKPINGQLARDNRTHTVSILDNDPLVNVEASVENLRESNTNSNNHPVFTISLTAPTNMDVIVPFRTVGTATKGVDYTVSPSSNFITIPAGQTSGQVTLSILEDTLDEDDETINLKIGELTGGAIFVRQSTEAILKCFDNWVVVSYQPPKAKNYPRCQRFPPSEIQTSVTINDEDGAPSLSWGTKSRTVTEGKKTLSYTIKLSKASGKDVSVALDFGGTAKRNADYKLSGLSASSLEIAAGETSATFRVTVQDDLSLESRENITMRMEKAENASLPRNKSKYRTRRITIKDNEKPLKKPQPQPFQIALDPNPTPLTGSVQVESEGNLPPLDDLPSLTLGVGTLALGTGARGLLDGATVYFDANFNGALDFLDLNFNGIQDDHEPSEPFSPTQLDGSFAIQVPPEFDIDQDGVFSTSEGRWISTGGVDSAIDLPLRLPMTAAVGHYVITPVSTLVERLVTFNGYQLVDAEERTLDAFSISGNGGLGILNPVRSTVSGNQAAAATEAASIQISSTVQQITDLFAGVPVSPSGDFFSDLVFTTLAEKIAPTGALVDLSVEAIVASVIDSVSSSSGILLDPNPATHSEIVSGAAQIIAAGNQAIDAIDKTVDLAYLERLFQVKKVMLGDASPALGEVTAGTRTIASAVAEFTGASLHSKIDQASIGMIVPPTVIAQPSTIVEEDSGQRMMEMVVQLIGDHNQDVSVDYATQDDTASVASGDYVPVQGTLNWVPGDNSDRIIQVPINGDTDFSPDKNFILVLSNPTAAVIGEALGFGFIINDDPLQHASTTTPSTGANDLLLELANNEFSLIENDELVSTGGIVLPTVMTISGQDSLDDALELDLSAAINGHSIAFHGGVGGDDSVEITEGTFQSLTHTWTGTKDGISEFLREGAEQPLTLSWNDIESFTSRTTITELILDLPFGTTDAILEDADPADTELAGMMRLRSASDAFEPIVFANPETSILVRGSGESFLTINSQDPAFTGTVGVVENYEPDPPGEVEVVGGDLIVTMPGQAAAEMTIAFDAASDQLVLSSTSSNVTAGSGTTQVWDAGVVVPMSSISGALIVNGGGFDDVLNLDFTGGNPIPDGGLTFSGGIGNNSLRVSGTGAENPIYTPDSAVFGDGEIEVGGRTIQFSGVEPVDFDNAGSVTLMLPGTDDVLDLASGFLSDGFTEATVVSGTSGGIAFSEARVSGSAIAIDTTQVDGDDSVAISSADNLHGNTGLTITTGSHNDTVSFDGTASFAGPMAISSPNIVLNADLSTTAGTTAGDLSLTGSVLVNASIVLDTSRVAGSGDVQIDGSLLLNEALAITSGTGDVNFTGAVDGQHALIIESQGASVFSSHVGSTTPLASLSVDAGGTTSVTNVTTIGLQNYGNDLLTGGVITTTNETVSVAGSTSATGPTTINVGSGLVSFNGGLNLSASTEIIANQIVLGSQLGIEINGPTIDSQYPQLKVSSPIELTDLELVISGSYQPTLADSFDIVSNESPNPFIGTFDGKDQWALVTINGGTNQKEITYLDGDGNDIALIRANTAPVALDDEVDTNEDTSLLINVLADNGNGADSDDESNLDPALTVNLSSPTRGTLVNNADGTFTFNPNGEFESLAVGESTTESFTYRIEDTRGETASGEVTITITGSNEQPTITLETGDSASTGLDENESGLTATGTLTVEDSDLTDTVATEVNSMMLGGTGVGSIPASLTPAMLQGFMTVDSGDVISNTATTGKINWSFDSNSEAFNFLATGETLILTYTIGAADSQSASATQDVVITITGTNDLPTITLETGDSASTGLDENESGLTATGTLTVEDSDLTDTVTSAVDSITVSGTGVGSVPASLTAAVLEGFMTVDSGNVIGATATTGKINWSFDSDGEAFNFLGTGETLILTYTIEAADSQNATNTQDVVVTIAGTNDVPVITVQAGDNASTGLDENESGLNAAGTLSVDDSDLTDTVTTAVDSVLLTGTGVGSIPASLTPATLQSFMTVDSGDVIGNTATTGKINWSFHSGGESFNFLSTGETLSLTYTVSATDSKNASVTQDVVITIAGINDEPTITLPSGSSNNIVIRKNGGNVEVIDQDTANILSSTALVNTRSLTIFGSETDADNVTLDYSLAAGGFFTLPGGIIVSGGSGAGDTLTVTGTGATQAVYSTVVSPAGQTQLTVSEASLSDIISYGDFEDLTFDGLLSFAAASVLSVGSGSLTIGATNPVDLGSLTLISGGTLTSSSPIALSSSEELIASGSALGVIDAEIGSLIQASGDLTLGDVTSDVGFSTLGQLETGTHTVTLLDADQAVLGAATTLGDSGVAGTLLAANGLYLATGNTLSGLGSVETHNLANKPFTNDGSVEGESLVNTITLRGFVDGFGSLDNVLLTGTYSPGLSPAAVSVGSVSYGSDSTTLIELGGTTPGSSGHDQINHSGTAALGGTLDVQLINGFSPSVGDAFVIMTSAGGITGTFDTEQLPAAPLGSGWNVVYGSTEVRIELIDLANVDSVQFGDGTNQHSRVEEIVVTFDGQVDIDSDAFTLLKRGAAGGTVGNSFGTALDSSGNTVATITFSGGFTRDGGALLDGYYQLTIDGSKVRRFGTQLTLDGDNDGLQGGAFNRGEQETDDFFALYADTNGDGLVGIAEFGQFRAAFGKTPTQTGYNELFDYDGLGVGISDFGQFRARFGKPKIPFE